MPDETLANLPLDDPLNNLVHRFVLLVAADHLDLAPALVSGKCGEILSNVENDCWLEHRRYSSVEFLKSSEPRACCAPG